MLILYYIPFCKLGSTCSPATNIPVDVMQSVKGCSPISNNLKLCQWIATQKLNMSLWRARVSTILLYLLLQLVMQDLDAAAQPCKTIP